MATTLSDFTRLIQEYGAAEWALEIEKCGLRLAEAALEIGPKLIAVASAATELALYDDFSLNADELTDPGLPDEPAAYVAARQALDAALRDMKAV